MLEEVGDRTMVTLSRSYHGGLTPGVMADQRKALKILLNLLTWFILFTLPGFELSTLNPWVSKQKLSHYAKLDLAFEFVNLLV